MNVVKGIVATIRTGRGVSVCMADGVWYGAGFDATKLTFEEGNTIQFTFTEKGIYKNIDLPSVEVVDASTASNMAPVAATPTPVKTSVVIDDTKMSKNDWTLKDKVIRYEDWLSRAISMVRLLVDNGAISLGAQVKKKAEVLENAVTAFTHKFYLEAGEVRSGDYDEKSELKEPTYE